MSEVRCSKGTSIRRYRTRPVCRCTGPDFLAFNCRSPALNHVTSDVFADVSHELKGSVNLCEFDIHHRYTDQLVTFEVFVAMLTQSQVGLTNFSQFDQFPITVLWNSKLLFCTPLVCLINDSQKRVARTAALTTTTFIGATSKDAPPSVRHPLSQYNAVRLLMVIRRHSAQPSSEGCPCQKVIPSSTQDHDLI
jgi:hypothetical protein